MVQELKVTHSMPVPLAWLTATVRLLNDMAGEGLHMVGQADPADLMKQIAEHLGVAEADDCWAAVLGTLGGSGMIDNRRVEFTTRKDENGNDVQVRHEYWTLADGTKFSTHIGPGYTPALGFGDSDVGCVMDVPVAEPQAMRSFCQVPLQPTKAMLDAAHEWWRGCYGRALSSAAIKGIWQAMLKAYLA
jgi:hypothetical protein